MRTMTLCSIWMSGYSVYISAPTPTPCHHPYPLQTFILTNFCHSSFIFFFFISPLSRLVILSALLLSLFSLSLSLSSRCSLFHRALHRHPKYNYSPQLNGEEGSSGIPRNRKWSGGLDWGGNSKSLIQLAEPWQQAPGDSYCGISGIKQCGSNHKRDFHPPQ